MAKITHRQVDENSAPASSSKGLCAVVTRFLREKTVLAVSAGCALVTMCFVRHGDSRAEAKSGLAAFEDMDD